MQIEIISPDKMLYEGTVTSVQLPGSEGSFQILNNHAPLITTLQKGSIKVDNGSETLTFEVNGGVIEMNNNKAIILAE